MLGFIFVFFFLVFLLLGHFSFLAFDWFFFSVDFAFDFLSVLFFFSLVFVFVNIVLFSGYYMAGELMFYWYFFSLLLFLFSMIFLCLGSSVFLLFIAWDGLGVTSFFLVLFYLNFSGVSGSLVTVLSNRFGDFCFFLIF